MGGSCPTAEWVGGEEEEEGDTQKGERGLNGDLVGVLRNGTDGEGCE